jgi:hypothetical protein
MYRHRVRAGDGRDPVEADSFLTIGNVIFSATRDSALTLAIPPAALAAQTESCEPVSQRAGRELGCFITPRQELGRLPKDSALYWHLDAYPTRAAAQVAKGPRGTVVESLGRTWLFTIAGARWRPSAGERVIAVGPLPLIGAEAYAAVYMEGVFRPGMLTQRAGDHGVMVPAGYPVMLTGTGTNVRRSLVPILQDASRPRSTQATDWTPTGLCSQ